RENGILRERTRKARRGGARRREVDSGVYRLDFRNRNDLLFRIRRGTRATQEARRRGVRPRQARASLKIREGVSGARLRTRDYARREIYPTRSSEDISASGNRNRRRYPRVRQARRSGAWEVGRRSLLAIRRDRTRSYPTGLRIGGKRDQARERHSDYKSRRGRLLPRSSIVRRQMEDRRRRRKGREAYRPSFGYLQNRSRTRRVAEYAISPRHRHRAGSATRRHDPSNPGIRRRNGPSRGIRFELLPARRRKPDARRRKSGACGTRGTFRRLPVYRGVR